MDDVQTDKTRANAELHEASNAQRTTVLRAGTRSLPLRKRTLVMGIVNLSEDSFSGDGLADPAAAVERATRFLSAGADILDVGAMSTRPGSMPIPEELEAARLAGVISLLRPLTDALISADSYRPGPAAAALKAGADIINDVTGLQDARIARLAAAHAAAVVVMHIQGTPETMQLAPTYTDLIGEVRAGLALGVQTALDAGVPHESIILDPGVGFGKNIEHNLELLRRLGELRFFGLPLLVGVSRKGFIGKITGREVHDRVEGTAAAVALAIANGADIVRVHDVRSMVAVCRMADAIVRTRPERE